MPTHPSITHLRAFSHTTRTLAKSTKQRLLSEHTAVPTYPYGPSQIYKQSNFGLYGTQKIRFGNMVSEKNEIKTRRFWRPNVHSKRLWSSALNTFVRIRVTTRVLRTIDKVGGLDEYLLGEKRARIRELGMAGWKLRWRIMQTEAVKRRFAAQRVSLGLPPVKETPTNAEGNLVSEAQVAQEIKVYDKMLETGAEIDVGDEADFKGAETEIEPGFMEEQSASKPGKIVL
ncbi:ribosomal L28 family-domain-containing protein [Bisporella sp. PMI_857]|nr:ribosomal L28 family-domain-containing protein [Bisporella sp. PMI_857]